MRYRMRQMRYRMRSMRQMGYRMRYCIRRIRHMRQMRWKLIRYSIRLSECLKTVGNFPGGTENKSNMFLHDIRKRILLSQFFFRSRTKKKWEGGLRQQSDMFLPETYISWSAQSNKIGMHIGQVKLYRSNVILTTHPISVSQPYQRTQRHILKLEHLQDALLKILAGQ